MDLLLPEKFCVFDRLECSLYRVDEHEYNRLAHTLVSKLRLVRSCAERAASLTTAGASATLLSRFRRTFDCDLFCFSPSSSSPDSWRFRQYKIEWCFPCSKVYMRIICKGRTLTGGTLRSSTVQTRLYGCGALLIRLIVVADRSRFHRDS